MTRIGVGKGLVVSSLLTGALACRAPARLPDPLRIAVPYELDTLDPHAKNTATNFAVASHFYEPLVTADPQMKLQPALARLWENPDPSTWVFHLRPDVLFHSGRPLRAADVVYSLHRLLEPGSGLEMGAYTFYIAEVAAVDPLTVRVRTTQPLSVLLNKLRFVMVVPEGARGEDLASTADGTGPFRLVSRTGERIAMRRHEAYWAASAAARNVELLLARDPLRAVADLLEGHAHLAQCNSRAAVAPLVHSEDYEIARRPSLFLKYLGFDMAREHSPHVDARPNPFRDARVRRALHLGIDRDAIVASLDGEALPAGQPVPPAIFGFNPGITVPEHSPEVARRLLAEAGFEGFRATLHTRRLVADGARLVAEQLRGLGLDIELEVLSDTDFLERARQRDVSLFVSRFGAPTGDASDILDTALHSPDPARHMGLGNYGGYSNAEVDRAIEDSAGIDSLDVRREALEQIMKMAMDDVAWVPLYVDQDVYAFRRELAWSPRADGFVLAAEILPAD